MNHRVIRVLVGKAGLDGHDKGALLLASRLRNAGMEVIYTGLRRTVTQIVTTAVQEDVDVIGISILSGAHLSIAAKLIARMEQEGITDKRLMMGGFIPEEDIPRLKAMGVAGVFTQGASFDDIAAFIRDAVAPEERLWSAFNPMLPKGGAMKEAGVGDWVTKRHRLTPDKVAVIFEEREWTYRELNERVNQAARMLLELGLVKGDRIAILANNCNPYLELFWACAKTGVVFVPLNTRLVSRELEYFIIQSAPEALFYGGEFSGMAKELKSLSGAGSVRNYICIDPPQDTTDGDYEAWIRRCPVEEPPVSDPPTLEDPQVILFTSGTTGRAKGAILPHRKTLWNTLNNENAFDYIISSVIYILNLPMFHSGGLFIATMPVIHKGGTLLIHRHFDPGLVLRDVERYRVSLLGGVPAMFQMIIAHPDFDRYDLSSLKGVAIGAQITPRSVLEQIRDRFKVEAVGQVFGATETSVCITLTPDRPKDLEKVGSIGLPLFHGEVKVAGKTGEPVRPGSGEIGEICYRGPMTMLGYLNDPEKTRETIDPEGWFHYGDMATVDEDGYIFVVDRKTDMYISGGENVYPKEVENILIDHPKIMMIAIIPMPDEKWGECGLAIVNPYPGQSLTAGEVLEFGVGKVAKYKLPKEVIVTDKPIPQTATGKIYKYKLIEEYVKGRQRP